MKANTRRGTRYDSFLEQKRQLGSFDGFDPGELPTFLKDFQAPVVDWSVRKGRSAILADCGLGKTPMQLVWADIVSRRASKPVLLLTPLAVSHQTMREAEKFGIEAARSLDGAVNGERIVVTNYERLHYFDPSDFCGAVCDESSILKSFDGKRRGQITEFMRKLPYRLLCTATAAPNDYIELGTSSEALGELGHMDMLSRFFKNDQNTCDTKGGRYRGAGGALDRYGPKWRFKGHAEVPFWRWVCSWARAFRRPSDLGFDDAEFILPELREQQHVIEASRLAPGQLFAMPAVGLREQREERRRTITERCEAVASLVETGKPALVWCHLNAEGDLLEKMIPDSIQVAGRHSDDQKEEALLGFAQGDIRVLVTKPKIGAWGLNFQHCAHVTFFPSHSFEQYYQGVRRCWRFGQTRPVQVDVVTTAGERSVLDNLQRKAAAADKMFSDLVAHMEDSMTLDRTTFATQEEVPAWL